LTAASWSRLPAILFFSCALKSGAVHGPLFFSRFSWGTCGRALHVPAQRSTLAGLSTDTKASAIMNRTQQWMEEFQKNISDLIARSPAADLERNMRSMMTQGFAKLDLITREEFDVQTDLLARARTRVDQLATQVQALEARLDDLERRGTRGSQPTSEA